MYYIGGTAAVLIVAVILFVYFQRPTFLGCCEGDMDKDGKKDINWMKTSALALAVGIVGALVVYGVLFYSSKKSSEVVSASSM